MGPKSKESQKTESVCKITKKQKKTTEISKQKPAAHTNGKNGH